MPNFQLNTSNLRQISQEDLGLPASVFKMDCQASGVSNTGDDLNAWGNLKTNPQTSPLEDKKQGGAVASDKDEFENIPEQDKLNIMGTR